MMKEELEKIREKAVQQITEAGNLDALNDIRVSFLGKKLCKQHATQNSI